MEVHIGNFIKEVLQKKGINKSEFARRINTTPQNVYGIFKRKSIDTDTLRQISEVLNYDFFQYYTKTNMVEENHAEYNLRNKKTLKTIAELSVELDKYKNEMEILKQENIYLKEINKLLKDRKK